jgi:hypothetical protein
MSTTGLESRIPQDYRHEAKLARPAAAVAVAGSALKWYDVARATAPVPDEIRALAREGLQDAARTGGLALADDVGFVILHRCGRDFYFLLVCTWRNQNEVWETVFAKDGEADPALARRRPAPADLLRLGARRRLPRAAGVDALPALGTRPRGAADVPRRRVRRLRVAAIPAPHNGGVRGSRRVPS